MKFLDPNYQEISLYCKTDRRHLTFPNYVLHWYRGFKYIIIWQTQRVNNTGQYSKYRGLTIQDYWAIRQTQRVNNP